MPDRTSALHPFPSDGRRQFAAWSGQRASLPPIAAPTGARRRRHLPVGTDVARARGAVRVCLDGWGVAPGVAVLVVSELLTHAVHREGGTRVDVELVDQRSRLTVVVEYDLPSRSADGRPGPAPTGTAPVSLGLTVVDRLTDRWGQAVADRRARLWAVVPTPATGSGPSSAAPPPVWTGSTALRAS